MVIDKSVYARRKPKKMNYDYRICVRFNGEEAEEYKSYYGKKWHSKIRQAMKEYYDRDKQIERIELAKRKQYLHNSYTVSSHDQL